MTREEALALKTFRNYCTCGGYAWQMNGRDRRHPHMAWCPQFEEYAEYIDALTSDEGVPAHFPQVATPEGDRGPVPRICRDCGSRHGRMPAGHISTWHRGTCGWCGEVRDVTEPRDYGYPERPA